MDHCRVFPCQDKFLAELYIVSAVLRCSPASTCPEENIEYSLCAVILQSLLGRAECNRSDGHPMLQARTTSEHSSSHIPTLSTAFTRSLKCGIYSNADRAWLLPPSRVARRTFPICRRFDLSSRLLRRQLKLEDERADCSPWTSYNVSPGPRLCWHLKSQQHSNYTRCRPAILCEYARGRYLTVPALKRSVTASLISLARVVFPFVELADSTPAPTASRAHHTQIALCRTGPQTAD